MSVPIVLVISERLGETHLQHLQSSLHAFVDSLPPTKLEEFHMDEQFHYTKPFSPLTPR